MKSIIKVRPDGQMIVNEHLVSTKDEMLFEIAMMTVTAKDPCDPTDEEVLRAMELAEVLAEGKGLSNEQLIKEAKELVA